MQLSLSIGGLIALAPQGSEWMQMLATMNGARAPLLEVTYHITGDGYLLAIRLDADLVVMYNRV
jgi:hypothetical protein